MPGTKDSCVGMGGCRELWQSSICSPLPAVSPSHACCPSSPHSTLAGRFPLLQHISAMFPCPSAQLGRLEAASPTLDRCHWGPDLSQHNLATPALYTGNLFHTLCQTLESLPQQFCRVLSPAPYFLDFRPHGGTDNVSADTPRACNNQPVKAGFLFLLCIGRGGPGNASGFVQSGPHPFGPDQGGSWHGRDTVAPLPVTTCGVDGMRLFWVLFSEV